MNQQTATAIAHITITGKGSRKSDGAMVYGATSQSEPNTIHIVGWDETGSQWQCDCKGFSYRGECRHVRALAAYLGAQRWSLTEAGAMRVAALRAAEVSQAAQAATREASMRQGPPAFSILK